MTLVAAMLSNLAFVEADTPGVKWLRRLDDANRIATAEKKDLLINFTGTEWCGWCKILDREVLGKKEFAPVADDFVLVDLDFPNDREQLADLHDSYEIWKTHYLIHAFPTIVLADSGGKPYAYTGYEKGLTPESFLAELRRHQLVRQKRDENLAAAKDSSGALRAQRLHAAIEAVGKSLGTIEDRRDDPVLALYADEVAEIRSLDADNSQKLRALYDARTAARDDYYRGEAVFRELAQFFGKGGCSQAVAFLDQRIPEVKGADLQWRLELARYSYLESEEQYAKALETAQRLVKDPRADLDRRDQLYRSLARCLVRLNRIDEAIAVYDQQIEAAADRPEAQLTFMDWKANFLLSTDRYAECIVAYHEFRAATQPFSKEWLEATGLLALAYVKNDQHREAIALHEEELELQRKNGADADVIDSLLWIARSQHALGNSDEARQSLHEAERCISAVAAKAAKIADQKSSDAQREILMKLRKVIDAEN